MAIEEHRMLDPGDTIIVAVSGGADSVALLDILASLEHLRLTLVVAHLNHGLRGAESDGDAEFVARLAGRYGLPLESESADVREMARAEGLSLEEAGRIARYRWFDELAEKHGARRIALGHHADDQAETFLLRLLRGAGTTGLRGMLPLSAGRYVRPLLALTRAEIEGYLKRRSLTWRDDRTNRDIRFLRNRIRHECIPYLATYNPAVKERLNAAAQILAADDEALESLVDQVIGRAGAVESKSVCLHIPLIRAELAGVRYRVYRRAVRLVKGDLALVSQCHLKQIDDLVHSSRVNGGLSLPRGFSVRRRYETLVFSRKEEKTAAAWEIRIDGPGTYPLPSGGSLIVRLVAPPVRWEDVPRSRAYFDPGKVPFPWFVRTFRPGDRFRPLGMTGTRKVKNFFIDAKVPADVRRRLPLLFGGGELLWVCGLRVAEAGRLIPGTLEAVEVDIPEITTYITCKTTVPMLFHQ